MLIIGGGVTGVGAALDAAARGLSVALVEARDLAAGTSSRSSKLIHGGLRYLEQLEFGLVHEALRERGLLATRLAPHLVRPVPILVPLTSDVGRGAVGPVLELAHRTWQRAYLGAGVALYDVFAGLVGQRPGHAAAPPPDPGVRPADLPVAARRQPDRRDPLLRRPGRRRALRDDDGAYRGIARRGRRHQRPGRVPDPGRAGGDRRPDPGRRDRRRSSTCRPVPWSPPPACGATTSARLLGDDAGADPDRPARARQQGRAPGGAALGDHRRGRADPADRDLGAVRAAVGRALDHRHHRHRLDARPRTSGGLRPRHRLPARPGQPVAGPAGHGRRHRGRLRRPAAAALRRGRGDLGAVPRARRGRADARV